MAAAGRKKRDRNAAEKQLINEQKVRFSNKSFLVVHGKNLTACILCDASGQLWGGS